MPSRMPIDVANNTVTINQPLLGPTGYGITNLAGSPTAFRLLIAAGAEAASRVKGQLRVVSSAGEPLNPEVIRWFEQHLAAPIHDH